MITKNVVLPCSPTRAFRLFTEHAGEWWPLERRHTKDEASVIYIQASGRFFERAGDGTEVDLGAVRLFEPDSRLVLDWYPGTDARNPTLVEVRFAAVDGGTHITLSHDLGDASDDLFLRNAPAYVRSWDIVLAALVSHLRSIA